MLKDASPLNCAKYRRLNLFNRTLRRRLLLACFTFLLQVNARAFSQNISYNANDVSLEKIFAEIKAQTGFSVFYNAEIIKGIPNVNVKATDLPLNDFLSRLFDNQPLGYSIKSKSISVFRKDPNGQGSESGKTNPVVATPIDVRGRVTDESGEPLVVTITVKGTKQSVSSNENGEFVLKGIDENAVLVITGVSLVQKEVKVEKKLQLTIVMKRDVKQNEEVVVTALGVERKVKELGYSVTKVSGDELNKTSPANIMQGLTGRVSGLSVSTQSADMNPKMKLLLRGIRSISPGANNVPLFVLNGSPVSFGTSQNAANMAMDFINNLNPNDVEDVTILKGANGTALYGPEGVNGVILITTKKGSKTGAPSINFQSTANFSLLDFRNQNIQTRFGPGNSRDAFGNPVYDPAGIGGWGPAYDGKMVQIGRPDENGEIQTTPYKFVKDRRRFYNISTNLQQMLTVTGGDSKSDFYLGIMYAKQSGLLPKDRKNQFGLALNTNRRVGKVEIRLNLQYIRTDMNEGPEMELENHPAHAPLLRYKDYVNDKWSDQNHYYSDHLENPYQLIDRVRKKTSINTLLTGLSAVYRPTTWLQITNRLGVNYQGEIIKSTSGPVYYSDWARPHGSLRAFDLDASLSEEMRHQTAINNDFLIQTVHKAGDFSIRGLAGTNIKDGYAKKMKGDARFLSIPVFNLDFNQLPADVEEYIEHTRSLSFYGEATGGYKDRVFFSLVARNDWDSKLAKVARKKNIYYGVNTSIILNQVIASMKDWDWLDEIKFRAALIKSANMNIAPFQSESILEKVEGFPYGRVIAYDRSSVANPYLKPEKIISQEYGLSISLLKKRAVLDITYYTQRNSGMILSVGSSGYSNAPSVDNVGKFLNFGWEADLSVAVVEKKKKDQGFSLDVGIHLSGNNNKLLELSDQYNGELYANVTEGAATIAQVGRHAYAYRVYDWLRDDQGRVIVDRQTGMPSVDFNNPVIRGRTLPRYLGGFRFNASYNRVSLNLVLEYNGGHDHYFKPGLKMFRNGTHPLTTMYDRNLFVFPNSVYKDGDKYVENKDVLVKSAGVDLYNLFAQASNHLLTSAAFWKVKELALAYEFTPRKFFAKKVTASIFGRDLFSFFPSSNIMGDPQLVNGPGGPRHSAISGGAGGRRDPERDNTAGSESDYSRVPGTVLFGARLNFNF